MNRVVLKSVLFEGVKRDILIEGNLFAKVRTPLEPSDFENAEIVDCSNFAVLPAFYNGHTHAAMTLLRGFADDMDLNRWLTQYVWPFEAKLTERDIAVGSRLAILEMIKSGTVFFADMYFNREETIRAVEDMGVRATIGVTISDKLMSPAKLEKNLEFLKNHTMESERVKLAAMLHSVYTASEKSFRRCIEISHAENYRLHVHLCETQKEVDDCRTQYGCSPLELVERNGGLNENLVAAHCVHFSEADCRKFAASGATAVINPCSNLKLGSGIPPIAAMLGAGVKLSFGTDGASSNNNLDMLEEVKFAALLAKVTGSAVTLPAEDALKMATENVACAYGVNGGAVAEGSLADCVLVDLNNERMVPCYNVVSNWVYAADSSAIDSVICNGRFVMRHRHVDGEEDIVGDAKACVRDLLRRL